ncbi:MAG: hypothetical protein CSA95_07025 [Bacteroidetes bacterium]|nr:MAG: hypothetical protein CSA95_07025 [Bacteroidota bacterium]PIE87862.1 MAG: hypothetical protein CSA04_04840 [Bacteroidota bacterium]
MPGFFYGNIANPTPNTFIKYHPNSTIRLLRSPSYQNIRFNCFFYQFRINQTIHYTSRVIFDQRHKKMEAFKENKKFQSTVKKAKELFWKHGIRRVSIEEICAKICIDL